MGATAEAGTAAATGLILFGGIESIAAMGQEALQTDALGAANMLTQGFDPTVSTNTGVAEAAQSAATTVASHGGSLIETLRQTAETAANTASNERVAALACFVAAVVAAAGALVMSD